jgi:hypothetical protein
MYRMQNPVEAEGGRLLRVLFLRGNAMPADARSAGERPAGVLLLMERSLIRQSRPSPFCARCPFAASLKARFFGTLSRVSTILVSAPLRVADKVDVTYRLVGNDGVDGAPNGISVPRWSLSKPI